MQCAFPSSYSFHFSFLPLTSPPSCPHHFLLPLLLFNDASWLSSVPCLLESWRQCLSLWVTLVAICKTLYTLNKNFLIRSAAGWSQTYGSGEVLEEKLWLTKNPVSYTVVYSGTSFCLYYTLPRACLFIVFFFFFFFFFPAPHMCIFMHVQTPTHIGV